MAPPALEQRPRYDLVVVGAGPAGATAAALAAIALAASGAVGWAIGLLDPSDAIFALVMAGLVLGRHVGNIRRATMH